MPSIAEQFFNSACWYEKAAYGSHRQWKQSMLMKAEKYLNMALKASEEGQ